MTDLRSWVVDQKSTAYRRKDEAHEADDAPSWNYYLGQQLAYMNMLHQMDDEQSIDSQMDELKEYVKEWRDDSIEMYEYSNGAQEAYYEGRWELSKKILNKIDELEGNNQTIGEQMEKLDNIDYFNEGARAISNSDEPIWPKQWSDIDEGGWLNFEDVMRIGNDTIYVNESMGKENADSNLWMPFDVYMEQFR